MNIRMNGGNWQTIAGRDHDRCEGLFRIRCFMTMNKRMAIATLLRMPSAISGLVGISCFRKKLPMKRTRARPIRIILRERFIAAF